MKCNLDDFRKDIASLNLTQEQQDELLNHIMGDHAYVC